MRTSRIARQPSTDDERTPSRPAGTTGRAPGEPRRPEVLDRASPALFAFGAAAALVVLAVLDL